MPLRQIIAREYVTVGPLRPPWLPRELDSILPLQGAWVRPLIQEPRPLTPQGSQKSGGEATLRMAPCGDAVSQKFLPD